MRKIITVSLALVLMLCFSAPAFAAPTSGSSTVTFEYVNNDPAYTISIPSTIELSAEGPVEVEVTADGVKNLDGKSISVTVGGTSTQRAFLLAGGSDLLYYDVTAADGTLLNGPDNGGAELARFNDSGVQILEFEPRTLPTGPNDINYFGTFVYDIALVD
jgi:type 1 fimbria pilin